MDNKLLFYLISTVILLNTAITCAVVYKYTSELEGYIRIKIDNHDYNTDYKLKNIQQDIKELERKIADPNETLVSVDEVIKALENMKNKGV